MIGSIRGTLTDKTPPQILVEVNGIGYEIDVPMSTFYELPEVGEPVFLFTHFIVREDAQLLYGFLTQEERRLFRILLRVTGVGARMALALLSGISVSDLLAAVHGQDYKPLTQVPGVGKKTAERLVLELRDRLKDWMVDAPVESLSIRENTANDVLHALVALGYSEKEALNAVKSLPENLEVSDGIRQALQWLSNSK